MKHTRHDDSILFDPPVHTSDDGRHIHISVGLPGIAEEQIRIDLERSTLTLSVSTDDHISRKVIQVPQGARFFKKKVCGGALEIILEKPVS